MLPGGFLDEFVGQLLCSTHAAQTPRAHIKLSGPKSHRTSWLWIAMPGLTDRERIVAVLEEREEAICDDCLVEPADLSARQRAYQVGSALVSRDRVLREKGRCGECGTRKTVTWIGEGEMPAATLEQIPPERAIEGSRDEEMPWSWEGNVQASLIEWLAQQGYSIRAYAKTAEHEAGKDIIAVGPEEDEVWIEVKGWPGPGNNTQARHYFSHALFSLILDRDERSDVRLAAAFPAGFSTFENLGERIGWLQEAMPFTVYWVVEDGSVHADRP